MAKKNWAEDFWDRLSDHIGKQDRAARDVQEALNELDSLTKRGYLLMHSFTDSKTFPQITQMAEFLSAKGDGEIVSFPRAPFFYKRWPRFRSWDRSTIDVAVKAGRDLVARGIDSLVVGGSSDGTWCHEAAIAMQAEGLPVSCIIHYGGLWRGAVANAPCVVTHGAGDRLKRVVSASDKVARDYQEAGHQVIQFVGKGNHRWDPRNNEKITRAVNYVEQLTKAKTKGLANS